MNHELIFEWEDGALVFTEGDDVRVSIRQDPVYGYWAVTGQCEGEFPSLSEAKSFVEEQLYKH